MRGTPDPQYARACATFINEPLNVMSKGRLYRVKEKKIVFECVDKQGSSNSGLKRPARIFRIFRGTVGKYDLMTNSIKTVR